MSKNEETHEERVERIHREDAEERARRYAQNPESAPVEADPDAANPPPAEAAKPETPVASDDNIRAAIAKLEADETAKSKDGKFKVEDINKVLHAEGYAPIKAADRDRVTGG